MKKYFISNKNYVIIFFKDNINIKSVILIGVENNYICFRTEYAHNSERFYPSNNMPCIFTKIAKRVNELIMPLINKQDNIIKIIDEIGEFLFKTYFKFFTQIDDFIKQDGIFQLLDLTK